MMKGRFVAGFHVRNDQVTLNLPGPPLSLLLLPLSALPCSYVRRCQNVHIRAESWSLKSDRNYVQHIHGSALYHRAATGNQG